MTAMYFQFASITIQVIMKSYQAIIFKEGRPIWAGTVDELILILEQAKE